MSHDIETLKQHPTALLLAEVVLALQQALGDDLIALVLYGSRARGDSRPDSDWDLLLIANNLSGGTFSRHLHVKSLLPAGWRGRIAVLAKTPAEFASHLPALFLDIALDGIILHDTDNYMAQRLAALRELLVRRGLHRQRRNGDFIWQWREFPGYDWQIAWEDALSTAVNLASAIGRNLETGGES